MKSQYTPEEEKRIAMAIAESKAFMAKYGQGWDVPQWYSRYSYRKAIVEPYVEEAVKPKGDSELPPMGRPLTPKISKWGEQIIKMYNQGLTHKYIAEKLDIPRSTISSFIYKIRSSQPEKLSR